MPRCRFARYADDAVVQPTHTIVVNDRGKINLVVFIGLGHLLALAMQSKVSSTPAIPPTNRRINPRMAEFDRFSSFGIRAYEGRRWYMTKASRYLSTCTRLIHSYFRTTLREFSGVGSASLHVAHRTSTIQ